MNADDKNEAFDRSDLGCALDDLCVAITRVAEEMRDRPHHPDREFRRSVAFWTIRSDILQGMSLGEIDAPHLELLRVLMTYWAMAMNPDRHESFVSATMHLQFAGNLEPIELVDGPEGPTYRWRAILDDEPSSGRAA